MFDTNIFNQILDGGLVIHDSIGMEYFVTNLQYAELNRTKNEQRRESLLEVFNVIKDNTNSSEIEQHSTPWGSPWDSPWDNGGIYYNSIIEALEKRKPKDRGNSYDAVMIETCKYEEIVFVSNDNAALEVSKEFKVKCMDLSEYLTHFEIDESSD